jgi:hypothetical protein
MVPVIADSGDSIPVNSGGESLPLREIDCMALHFMHQLRQKSGWAAFDTVRAVFTEGEPLYPTASFRRKTHIQICVRNQDCLKGMFRVPDQHFSAARL